MSASIATAICATVSAEVADPAVFQVMTRRLVVGLRRGACRCRARGRRGSAPFATAATPAISASDEREARAAAATSASSSATTSDATKREHEQTAEGDDLRDREDPLDAEERRAT